MDNDFPLHYRLSGPEHAPVLVLSNSLGTDFHMWRAQHEALSQHFRVLNYDVRGHGRSRLIDEEFTLAALGQDVLALLDRLDIERAHFCGISMGGLTGLWLGTHAPQRLQKLVVANSAARIGEARAWQTRADSVRHGGMGELAASAAERWFSPAFRVAQQAEVERLSNQLRQTSPEGYARCCEALAQADLRQQLAAINCPVLLIAGTEDPVTTAADADAMAAQIAGARRVDLPASHLSNIEAAAQFNRVVIDFLQH